MLKRLLAPLVLAVALVAAPAFATTTWSKDSTTPYRVAKAVCTTGSESAPSGISSGLSLAGVRAFTVHIEAAAAMTAGGTLQAYLWNPVTQRWNRAPDLDLSVAAVQYQSFAGFTVGSDLAAISYVPVGIGQASTIYLISER